MFPPMNHTKESSLRLSLITSMTTLQPTVDIYLNPESCEWHLLSIQLSLYLKQSQKQLNGKVSDTALQQEVKFKRLMNSQRILFFRNTYLNALPVRGLKV